MTRTSFDARIPEMIDDLGNAGKGDEATRMAVKQYIADLQTRVMKLENLQEYLVKQRDRASAENVTLRAQVEALTKAIGDALDCCPPKPLVAPAKTSNVPSPVTAMRYFYEDLEPEKPQRRSFLAKFKSGPKRTPHELSGFALDRTDALRLIRNLYCDADEVELFWEDLT